ncbi:MAG: tRNA (adenosine(37)-N6)-threonylcarbamoyltransferase complex ATPase subunit type 1 TsaE [Coriobacteriia bacterium]|nr:tRNA (adenosine(37)-N6)-threonylcarbamoyltransferase complex ATPase subunit type 1 TsaE [Coriobacteriia bacterium]
MGDMFTTQSAEETEWVGRLLASCLQAGDVIALSGDLGAGKTHLVQGVASGLGVDGAVTSPTFNILLVHAGRLPLYHLDLYRLDDPAQLEDIDFYATLEGDGVSFIEWGDRFPDELPADHLLVEISRLSETGRDFRLTPGGPRSAEVASAWSRAVHEGAGR